MNLLTTTIEPRFSETDGLGHIGNTVLPVWLEYARTSTFKRLKIVDSLMDIPLLVAHMNIDFIAQIYVEPPVDIKTQITKFGNSSMNITQQVFQNGKIVAQGENVLVLFDQTTQRPKSISADLREKLSPLLQQPNAEAEKQARR